MKNVNSFVFILTVLMTGISGSCHGLNLSPYFGVDAELRLMKFKKNFGNNEFKQNYYPQGNPFIGLKFNDYFGIELGYFSTVSVKNHSIASQDIRFGVNLPPNEIIISDNRILLNGARVDLMGFWPIDDRNRLIGSIGISRTAAKLLHQPTANETHVFPPDERAEERQDFFSRKYIARLQGGFQHDFIENFGIRALLGWENTSKFKNIASKQATRSRTTLEDSYQISLGFVFQF